MPSKRRPRHPWRKSTLRQRLRRRRAALRRSSALLEKAAKQNQAQAQYNLGIYHARFSDKEFVRLALKWLNEAAKQDYADAQYNLAQLYLNPHHPASCEPGAGRRAIALLTRAAAQGHAGAKAKLKELGIAVPQSSATVD